MAMAVVLRLFMGNSLAARLKWVSGSELANTFGDAVLCESFSLEQVVAGVVGSNPVRDGIDVKPDLLARLSFTNQHLTGRDEVGDDVNFGVIQMKRFAVDLGVYLRVGEENLGWAALGDNRQHSRFLKLLDGLRGEDHCRVMLAPGLLSGHDVGADGLVLDEEPSLVHQESLEGRQFLRVRNLVA